MEETKKNARDGEGGKQGGTKDLMVGGRRLLVCDCEGTMPIKGKALAKAFGGTDINVNHHLCRSQLAEFERVAGAGAPLLVACTQEAPLFLEVLDGIEGAADAGGARFVNIRERAGWSADRTAALPKMAALIAEATLEMKPTTTVTMSSEGTVLVLGDGEAALDAAKQLAQRLDVTALLSGNKGAPGDGRDMTPPRLMDVPVFQGRVTEARGHLGAFEVTVEGFAPASPSSWSRLTFGDSTGTGTSSCDLILDLRGGPPLFTGGERRDGYFNPDPGDPALVQKTLFTIVDMVGTFEKPRYIDFDAALCAHGRSGVTGCTRCLDLCPTGAITSAGDSVAIDAQVCAGCGHCASVCPTGAATYAMPADNGLLQRLRTLLATYTGAGGTDPVLLVHDTVHGEEMIDAMARFGGGLPANVLPFAVNQVTQAGSDFLLAAHAYGAGQIILLLPPAQHDEATGLAEQVALTDTVLAGLGYGADRLRIVADADPEAVEGLLRALPAMAPLSPGNFLPMGRKRALLGLALKTLHDNAPTPIDTITLPAGAPFGTVAIDVAGCTLCLACVGACPTTALRDSPEKPQLRFLEEACVQCGLCAQTCPENVIALDARINFTDDARALRTLKEEEPFACIRCGKEYGTRSSIERMVEKLSGHSMFADGSRLDLIRMCDECRVIVQMETNDNPLAGPARPLTRTTEDYLREREELRQQAKEAMEGMEAEKKDET